MLILVGYLLGMILTNPISIYGMDSIFDHEVTDD